MQRLIEIYVRGRELGTKFKRGQTMSEYALILAGVAIVVFAAYVSMGQAINSMVEWLAIDNDLTGHL